MNRNGINHQVIKPGKDTKMVFNLVDNYTVRKVTMYSSFTCIYIPITILILLYTDNLYNIGKITTYYFLVALFAAECIKIAFTHFLLRSHATKEQQKLSKMKKSSTKLRIKEIFQSIVTTVTAVCAFYVIAVLFGASVFSEREETVSLSMLIVVLTVIPSCLNLGASNTVSLLLGAKPPAGDIMQEAIGTCIKMTLLGVWLGAVVIPLDWDRPWQAWPIPCCLGAIAGHIAGHIFTLGKLMPSIAKMFSKNFG